MLIELNCALQALIAHCREAKPDLLLLLGPFVDSDQPKIRMGLVDQVYQDVFQEGVRPLFISRPLKNSCPCAMQMQAICGLWFGLFVKDATRTMRIRPI